MKRSRTGNKSFTKDANRTAPQNYWVPMRGGIRL